MDAVLHCNAIKCRAACVDQAVVTTCSHIFCLRCADDLGLSNPKDGRRTCPACSAQLDLLDDAVCTTLNPSEDYKTSILSGFSPTVIMDCVSRGLGFWSYQMTQEINYQAFLGKTLSERFRTMSDKLDRKLREATDENQRLYEKINALSGNLDDIANENRRLQEKLQEKSAELTRRTNAYQKLFRTNLVPGVEMAAEQDADQVAQSAATHNQQRDPNYHPNIHRAGRQNSEGSAGAEDRRRLTLNNNSHDYRGAQASRTGQSTSHSISNSIPVGGNRTPLPNPNYNNYGAKVLGSLAGQPFQRTGSNRASYQTGGTGLYGSGGSPAGGQGLSANVRIGRPQPQYAPLPQYLQQGGSYQGGMPLNMSVR